MRIHHALTGNDIDTQSVEDAIQLSEAKYCSVGAMLRESGAQISTTYSIQSVDVEDDTETATAALKA